MPEIIVKNFKPHYNIALDKVVTSERQYKEEMKRGGYISADAGNEIVKRNLEKQREFKVSKNAEQWMREVKLKSDRDGNVKLSDRQVDAMRKMGMSFKDPHLSETRGGFR